MTWLLSLPGKIAAGAGVALLAVLAFFARLRIERARGRDDAEQEARDNALEAEQSRARTDRDAGGGLRDEFHRD